MQPTVAWNNQTENTFENDLRKCKLERSWSIIVHITPVKEHVLQFYIVGVAEQVLQVMEHGHNYENTAIIEWNNGESQSYIENRQRDRPVAEQVLEVMEHKGHRFKIQLAYNRMKYWRYSLIYWNRQRDRPREVKLKLCVNFELSTEAMERF